ncbi:Rv3654c family TadE-like protein [Schaalia odontolytica]|uniref:Rv3654c family TadE-like protein n=1 Tax=Schaalia odontolytica TaxID=1660 RepID=UPI0028D47E29|nr:Rv3654c family TadE-like protein [Schaalia odontolytica]
MTSGPADGKITSSGDALKRASDPRALEGEAGSGTVNSVGLIALAILVALIIAGVGAAHRASVRLQAVADLAALAGAEHSMTAPWEEVGGRPCQAASSVVAANGEELLSCEVRGSDCLVVISRTVRVAGIPMTMRARARGGPGE